MITWPNTLPQSPGVDFSISYSEGLLKESEQNSPVRTRTYPEKTSSFTFEGLTNTQADTLRNFWGTSLNQSAPFIAPWLSSLESNPVFSRFISPPSFTKNDLSWDVTVSLEIITSVPLANNAVNYWVLQ